MMTDEEFAEWCRKCNVSEEAQKMVVEIRNSPPSRRVGGGPGGVSGRFPSRKTRTVLQFSSHRVVLPFLQQMDLDPKVKEIWDQPPPIPLEYQKANGRWVSIRQTADFFVLYEDRAGWVEIRTEEELVRLSQVAPNRYRRDEDMGWNTHDDGCWCCPPAEAYTAQYGLVYYVWSADEINWNYQRNIHYLDEYIDAPAPPAAVQDHLCKLVADEPGITLEALAAKAAPEASRDAIYWMITHGALWVDLCARPIKDDDLVQVFVGQDTTGAQGLAVEPARPGRPCVVDFTAGSSFWWDGRCWTVAMVGDSQLMLQGDDEKPLFLPLATLEVLVKEGKITGTTQTSPNSAIERLLVRASDADKEIAKRRQQFVLPHLADEWVPEEEMPGRTLRRWVRKYLRAKEKYGWGFLGLLPRIAWRGNREPRFDDGMLELVKVIIDEEYLKPTQKNKFAAWSYLVRACDGLNAHRSTGEKELKPPSFASFSLMLDRISLHERVRQRRGRKAAYPYEPFYWYLSMTTPVHGDRPWEIAHIDHTPFPVELRCSKTHENLGCAWFTLMVDAFTRRVLAVYLTYDPPSYRSVMMVLRDCVRRWRRLPRTIVVDGGAEFHSTYCETLLAFYEVIQKTRPAGKPRFGSVVERLFGTTMTEFAYLLTGNTQMGDGNLRQITPSVDPKRLAVWTLGDLYEHLCHYLFETYDTSTHRTLGQSPRGAYEAGMAQAGARSHRLIPYDREFLINTLPTTPKGTATVQPDGSIKINNLHYSQQALRDARVVKRPVPVKYDPFDAGHAFAFVRGEWVECFARNYAEFQGRTEKELMLYSSEVKKRLQFSSDDQLEEARERAETQGRVKDKEEALAQRWRDLETSQLHDGLTLPATRAQETPAELPEAHPLPSPEPPAETSEEPEYYGEL